MQYSIYPKTGEKISRLGYGAMGLGGAFGTFDEQEGIRSVLLYLEKGGNFIDTARHYGKSEEITGKALQQWKGKPPFIATKIQSHGPDNTRWCIPSSPEQTFPKKLIRENTETSLRFLKVDCIDLMQLHLYWPTWGVNGYWLDELVKLKEEGKIKSIGVSLPDCRGDVGIPLVMSGAIDCVQSIINIFDPRDLDVLVPICQKHNVAVIARCILDEGGLSGFLKEETQFENQDFRKTFFEEVPRKMYMKHIDELRQFIPMHAKTLAALAIKFMLKHPGITTAIASMHIEKFLQENISALEEASLPDDVWYNIHTHHRWVRNFYNKKYWQKVNDLDVANELEKSKK